MTERLVPLSYDETSIAAVYDQSRCLEEATLDEWVKEIEILAPHHDKSEVLDLGCGTGRFSRVLATHYERVAGVDPSAAMLAEAEARAQPRCRFEQAGAEALPFAESTFSLVFLSMVFHHFRQAALAASEISRVLRAGGLVAVRNATKQDIEDNPLFQFFPRAREIELARMPSSDDLVGTFEAAGLRPIATRRKQQVSAKSWQEYRHKVGLRSLSVFQFLKDEEIEAGLSALTRFADLQSSHESVNETFTLAILQKP